RGREAGQPPLVVLGSSRERADLVEAAGVDQRVDALAHGELAGLVLTGDLLLAAHRGRQLGAPPQLVELGIPGHSATASLAPSQAPALRWRSAKPPPPRAHRTLAIRERAQHVPPAPLHAAARRDRDPAR